MKTLDTEVSRDEQKHHVFKTHPLPKAQTSVSLTLKMILHTGTRKGYIVTGKIISGRHRKEFKTRITCHSTKMSIHIREVGESNPL